MLELIVGRFFLDHQAHQQMTCHFKVSLQCRAFPITGFVRHIAQLGVSITPITGAAPSLFPLCRAVELDPRSVDHLLQQALIQAEDRQLKDCRNLCRKALKLDPTHWGLTHLLAVMLTGEKKLKEALQLVNFALVHWPRLFG